LRNALLASVSRSKLLASTGKVYSMIKKKKRKRPSFAPMGTPGAGPGWHRSASPRGAGRLGRALKRLPKGDITAPKQPEKSKARALAEWENEGGQVAAATSPAKPLRTPAKKGNNDSGKSRPRKQAPKDVKRGPAPSPQSPVGSAQQKRARTAAKDARQKEAGLEGRRVGKASASGKRAQARRNSKQ